MLLTQSSSSELTGLAGWVADVMETLGAVGVGALVALETLFPPIPSEVVLLLAGFLSGQGSMNLAAVILMATIGSLVGSYALYGLGAALGRTRFMQIVDWMPLVDIADIEKAEVWFGRHGGKAVFLGRLVPLIRSGISVPAGLTRMPLLKFTLYTVTGSFIWNTLFIVLGYVLGDQWEDAGRYSDWISNAVLAAIALVAVWLVVRYLRRRKLRALTGDMRDPI